VNSFGFGGANAHVILQSAEQHLAPAQPTFNDERTCCPLIVSSRTRQGLKANASALASYLRKHPGVDIHDAAWHSAFRRTWHEHRAIVAAANSADAATALESIAQNNDHPSATIDTALQNTNGPVFVYSGNGSQWEGMGLALLQHPVFSDAIDEVDRHFQPRTG